MSVATRAKTYSAKPPHHEGGVTKEWILVDAENAVVGRLATFIAMRLRGKHRADYTPHVDCGDNVVVINAGKVVFTGKKYDDKIYHKHTGYPGGVKETTPKRILEGKHPERVLKLAVQRMLPKESPLARDQLANLKIYAGPDHPHAAQQPKTIDFKGRNRKNVRIG